MDAVNQSETAEQNKIAHQSIFRLENARKSLAISVKSWFVIALTGQWAFALYISLVYTVTLVLGIDIVEITPTQGYKKAEDFDRIMFFSHIIPAAYLSLFGLFQLLPSIRNRYPGFHRWNGRIFLLLGFTGALTGLYLQWITGLRLSDVGSLGITLNGILILVAVYMAWYHAAGRRIAQHMRWAIHAFILVNAVWTFRLYLMGWFFVNQGGNGNSRNMDGPMDIFLTFACYLLPMAMAEVYFWAKKQRSHQRVWASTLVMVFGATITLIGVFAALMMMWSPRISQALEVLF